MNKNMSKITKRNKRLGKVEKVEESERFCPTPGCYGFGNKNDKYKWHYTRHSCPLNDGNVMNVRIGKKKKYSKVVEIPIEANERVFDKRDKTWHYFIMIGGEGSAQISVYNDVEDDQHVKEEPSDRGLIQAKIIGLEDLKQEIIEENTVEKFNRSFMKTKMKNSVMKNTI